MEQLDKLEELTAPVGSAGPEDEELAELMKRFHQAAVQVCVFHLACVHLGERKKKKIKIRKFAKLQFEIGFFCCTKVLI